MQFGGPRVTLHLQTTIKSQISCTGIGVHSGKKVHMCLRPAAANTGIVFKRIDVPRDRQRVEAKYDAVSNTFLGTTVSNKFGVEVATIEHLMAALVGCGIDNVLVELDGGEVPVMDGSSAPYVFLIECAGRLELSAPRRQIEVLEPVTVEHEGARASLYPADKFEVLMEIDFDSSVIGKQRFECEVNSDSFKHNLSRARTFGFFDQVEQMQKAGRALGGSLENSIVIQGETVLNSGGLRFEDEFVRHKALDAIGDLALAGAPILGRFEGDCSGHHLNNLLLREMFSREGAWRWVGESLPQEGRLRRRVAVGAGQPSVALA